MNKAYTQQILALIQDKGIIGAKDLRTLNIPHVYLRRMVEKGILHRIGYGLYRLPNSPVTKHHSLVEACTRIPEGVICLLSALNFHSLTTQLPFEIWIAIENKAWSPKENQLPIHLVRFSGSAFTEGIEEHTLEGRSVRVYNAAKTVADCFKYRNKIGLDVALEALRDGLRQHQFTVDQLWYYAGICRAQNVLRPYLEATL